MVTFGAGVSGSKTITQRTEFATDIRSFTDLTIETGEILELPFGGLLLVNGTLTVDGLINGNGLPRSRGGPTPPCITVVAKEIKGNGRIGANGEDGFSQASSRNFSAGPGFRSRPSTFTPAGSGANGANAGDDRGGDATEAPDTTIYSAGSLGKYLENRLLTGQQIAGVPTSLLLGSAGGVGGQGANSERGDFGGGGGGGGSGGSFGGRGGKGGRGGDGDSVFGQSERGGHGGEGGTSGGVVQLITETLTAEFLAVSVSGGAGGDGGDSNTAPDGQDTTGAGGGGGGGSGGVILLFSDGAEQVNFTVNGGPGGEGGNSTGDGEDGAPGEPGSRGVALTFPFSRLS